MDSASPTLLATDHELFVGDLIDQMRKQRQEKSRSYRHLPYFQHLGSEEVFEALDRVRQANLLQMQLKMQKDCSYLQHMDDMSLEGRNAESVRKRVQEGKLQGGFRQVQSQGHTTVCGCLDCQLRLGNKQFNSSFQYEQSKEALAKKVQLSKLSFLGAAWHGKPMLAMHLANEGGAPDAPGTALHAAVLRGDAELVRLLCSRSECDTSTTWSGITALDLAVAKGFDDGGDVLLQHGAPLMHFQHESLAEAIDRGNMLLLRALLQQMGIYSHQGPFSSDTASDVLSCTNADGNTPLHLACLLPDREAAVKLLVAHGADSNKENAEGMTALDCCVQASNRGAWRALRHATGGQAKYRRYEAEQRSFRAAVTSNCLFLVRNVHLRQDDERKGDKPRSDLGDMLHLAVSTSGISDDLVQYLVEQGADVNAVKDGFSVLDACLHHNYVSEGLLGRHARLSRFQDCSLCTAAKEGRTGLVRYLANTARKGGKDGVNQREHGFLPLHFAAAGGYVDVVKVLLKGSGNAHEQTDDGRTALDLACEQLAHLPVRSSTGDTDTDDTKMFLALCHTVDALLSRGSRLKEFRDEAHLDCAREAVQREAEKTRHHAQEQRERDEARGETRRQLRRRREESDETLKHVEREVKSSVTEEERKAEAFKESERLAKKVAESREVLQASWKGEGEKLPEYLSSKYYQIRIDVLRRKIQEKDQQIEEALKKMDFAEEDYLWLLRKKMRDLRLKYHPDKITDRAPTEEDYKFYERITKAYDVLCTKEERDKYLEMSNHVEWLQQHGEEEEARLVEKAIYDMETQKKAKKDEKKEEESAQPPREHVERAKKKLQERREEDSWEKTGEKIKALTLGTPNKCKAPVVTAQRFAERLEQCWIDIEWVCKCAYASAERIEYELRVQAIDKGAEDWAEVYHGWESSVSGLGPFPVGTYEFMVRARNSIGWGEWSDVIVVTLDDPKWEKQQRREAEQQALREQAKQLQWDLQQIVDEFEEMQGENKLTIHRASNLLFHLQAELKRARAVRSYLPKPGILREAEAAVRLLERWRDRKEAFAEWKQSLSEMKSQLLQEGPAELSHFLSHDEHYFGSLTPEIRNLIVQTLLGLDAKQVFKRLTTATRDHILGVLRRGMELGRCVLPAGSERSDEAVSSPALAGRADKGGTGATASSASTAPAVAVSSDKSRTIFTKHQTEQLQRLADRFSGAQCRAPPSPATGASPGDTGPPGAGTGSPLGVASTPSSPLASSGYPAERGLASPIVTGSRQGDRGGSEEPGILAEIFHTGEMPSTGGQASLSMGSTAASASNAAAPCVSPLSGGSTGGLNSELDASPDDRASSLKGGEKRLRTVHIVGLPHREHITRGDLVSALRPFAEVDGARVGTTDALVRFTTAEEAKQALIALEQGCVTLRRSILSGQLAPADSLTEEALLRASGKSPAEKRVPPPPVPAKAALPQQSAPVAQQRRQAQTQAQHVQPPPPPPPPPPQQHRPEHFLQQMQGPLPPPAPAQQARQQVPQMHTRSQPPMPPVQQSPVVAEITEPSVPTRNVRINVDQLMNTDGSTSMFECPLCNGVAWQPKVTMCCQKVFCGQCLDNWLLNSTTCPQCHVPVIVRDGSTGGCSDQRIKRLDRTSQGVQAVLWRVYGNLRVRCVHNECPWTGNILKYFEHLSACRAEQSQASKQLQQPPSRPVQSGGPAGMMLGPPGSDAAVGSTGGTMLGMAAKGPGGPLPHLAAAVSSVSPAPAAFGASGCSGLFSDAKGPSAPGEEPYGNCVVVWEHRATDDSQLSLKVGDRVSVKQVAAHGWVYGHRLSDGNGQLAQPVGPTEGWFPSFCMPENRPPRPQQSPPPASPPAGSTKVARDYEASDPAQLSVKEGELVYVRQRDQSGWTFVVRVSTQGAGKREGWVPDWLLKVES